jgi:hypothetical protein
MQRRKWSSKDKLTIVLEGLKGDSSPNKNAAGNVAVEFGDLVCYNRALNENMAGKGIKCKRQRLE